MTDTRKPNLIRSAPHTAEDGVFSHPLNPQSEVHLRSLSDATGLERLGFHIARIPPGKESFVYHMHYTEEEFIYVLAGRGIAEIGDELHKVGPGDFMGFPTPSVGHHLRNPFAEDLVYLIGGERRGSEVADITRQGKRLVRVGMNIAIHDLDDAAAMPPFPRLGDASPNAGPQSPTT